MRGLIQDHVIGAVRLTKRDTFIDRNEFCALVSIACVHEERSIGSNHLRSSELQVLEEAPVVVPPPAILKPRPLWTGKQVRAANLLQL